MPLNFLYVQNSTNRLVDPEGLLPFPIPQPQSNTFKPSPIRCPNIEYRYYPDDVDYCLLYVRGAQVGGGWLFGYNCAAHLLAHFFGGTGTTYCPPECRTPVISSFLYTKLLQNCVEPFIKDADPPCCQKSFNTKVCRSQVLIFEDTKDKEPDPFYAFGSYSTVGFFLTCDFNCQRNWSSRCCDCGIDCLEPVSKRNFIKVGLARGLH